MRTQTLEIQRAMTPQKALEILHQGNLRFINNLKFHRDLLEQVNVTSSGQYPFATILSCIDSRTSAELIFDQGLGDIFSIRIAGNFINEDILGSMEFACKVAGSKLLLVLGHTRCGAIKGACDEVKMGNLTQLLEKIKPAVNAAKQSLGKQTLGNDEFVDKVAYFNVEFAIRNIMSRSPILREMQDNNEIAIVGGVYDVQSGKVEFLGYENLNGVQLSMGGPS